MAITIDKYPGSIHSGYNPANYTIDSTNKNLIGFRYVVEIYSNSPSEKIAELFVAPDPLDGGKGKIDVSRILQNKLESYFTTTSFNATDAVTSYFNYQIRFGESISSEWEFNDYVWLPGNGLALTTDSTYGSGFSNTSHNYQVDDQIRVRLNGTYPDNRDLLNTFFEVIEVVDTKTIRITGDFGDIGSFPATPGKSVYADNRKNVTRNMTRVNSIAINTAMDLKEYSNTGGVMTNYVTNASGSPTKSLLTNQPDVYSVTPEQFLFFNILYGNTGISMYFENDDGEVFTKSLAKNNTVTSMGVGPGNLGTLTPISGSSLPLIKPDTKYYKVSYRQNTSTAKSKEYKFIIDRRCQINDTQIMFMDRKGSYNSFAFQLKHRENINTTKQTFNRFIDNYSTESKGETVYHSEAEKSLSLVTNFMGESMNMYFQELMTSRNTYILWEGSWYSCIVNDTSFENEYERNNKMINKSISVRFAVNNPIN